VSKTSLETAIGSFLKSESHEVLCIRGKWGTGKTYLWNETLKAVARRGEVAFDRYAYISLFGLNSLADLKTAVIEQTISVTKKENLELAPTEESIRDILKRGEELVRKGSSVAGGVLGAVGLGALGSTANRLMLATIKRQIVCFDDLERRGTGLSMNDVLGMASHLKEERKCKVVLILNDEKLEKNAEKDFKRYLEKVIDIAMVFEPTVEECTAIALGEQSPLIAQVARYMRILEVSNIRVIQRIKHLIDQISPLMAGRDARMLPEAVKTLCLLGWVEYLPDVAPPWDFVKSRFFGRAVTMTQGGVESPEEKRWNEVLFGMNIGELNELDMTLQMSVRRGYFDNEALGGFIELVEKRLQNEDLEVKLARAFWMYERTLAPNENEVAAALIEAATDNVKRISTPTLNAIVVALRELGRNADATKLLNFVVQERSEDTAFFKPPEHQLITDRELIETLASMSHYERDERSLLQIIKKRNFGYDDGSIERLKEASVSDLKEALKALDDSLEQTLGALLKLEELARNGVAIRDNVFRALTELSSETRINRIRLKNYVSKPPPWENRAEGRGAR
jgi:hypothetical protein